MMLEGSSSPQESTTTQIIKTILCSLKPVGSKLAILPLERRGHKCWCTQERRDRRLEVKDREAIEVDNENEEVPKVANEWQQSTQVPKSFGSPMLNVQEVGEAKLPLLLQLQICF